ncbi:hypothetical protein HDU79_009203 [Rhizoclosmatium sp. JEL0117]|nr:hypothetical protein HDU79_009203 [Rhizoclosmatium sp. JEL0117]
MDDCGLLFKSEHSRIRQAFIETLFPATSAFYKHKTTVYYLPLGGGKVYHIRNPFMGKSGFTIADQILESFLDAKQLPLSRRTFLVHKLSGFLSQQFSFNVGKAYRYASDQPASRFEDAPSPVQSAFQHLQNLIPNLHINELLILGYLKGQKMNFHTDDEMGLGPTVVSWSFGSPAQMWFRERPVSIRRPVSEEDVNVLLDPSCMVMSIHLYFSNHHSHFSFQIYPYPPYLHSRHYFQISHPL